MADERTYGGKTLDEWEPAAREVDDQAILDFIAEIRRLGTDIEALVQERLAEHSVNEDEFNGECWEAIKAALNAISYDWSGDPLTADAAKHELIREFKERDDQISRLDDELDEAADKLHKIRQWALAYPVDMFTEPTPKDLKDAAEALKAIGLTSDALHASWARRIMSGILKIIDGEEA